MTMHLNDDLTVRTVVHAGNMDWTPSPSKGVDRRMLFRVGEEKSRATSIVRYAPQSRFPRHSHPGGEEILVLDGIFQDENGDYPAGSYIRNPPASGHAPGSETGCVIFVKLWQFRDDDSLNIVRLAEEVRQGARSDSDHVSSTVLFGSAFENVRFEDWAPGATVECPNLDGLELLVLSGGFSDTEEAFERLSWLRLPAGAPLQARAGSTGCRVWLKAARLLQNEAGDF